MSLIEKQHVSISSHWHFKLIGTLQAEKTKNLCKNISGSLPKRGLLIRSGSYSNPAISSKEENITLICITSMHFFKLMSYPQKKRLRFYNG